MYYQLLRLGTNTQTEVSTPYKPGRKYLLHHKSREEVCIIYDLNYRPYQLFLYSMLPNALLGIECPEIDVG